MNEIQKTLTLGIGNTCCEIPVTIQYNSYPKLQGFGQSPPEPFSINIMQISVGLAKNGEKTFISLNRLFTDDFYAELESELAEELK